MKSTKNDSAYSTMRSYRNLILIPGFKERYEYLKLQGVVGESLFGFNRYMNQEFYTSREWRNFRNHIIARDEGCDMGHPDYPIQGPIIIHHLNPLLIEDFENSSDALFDENNVVCVSKRIHDAIHYGDESLLPGDPILRTPNDTCPWR